MDGVTINLATATPHNIKWGYGYPGYTRMILISIAMIASHSATFPLEDN